MTKKKQSGNGRSELDLKYELYERAVQSPDVHVDWYGGWYKDLRGKQARVLREDFCGTYAVCCEWVKLRPENTAIAVDLDPEPLSYGRRVHAAKLDPEQRKRIQVLNQNVLSVTKPQADLISASNFSFNVFFERSTLVEYFRCALKSLRNDGIIVLEMAGGPGMIEKTKDRQVIRDKKKPKFQYIWDQKSFDPISHEVNYAIHFKFLEGPRNGEILQDAFTYHWRLWTIPELRDALAEAGFSRSVIYWETTHKGEGTGEYALADKGTNDHSWVAYIVGLK